MIREKVIEGLEIQLDDLQKYAEADETLMLTQEQAKEILALLKEQEPVRCKDCKFGKESCGNMKCHKPGMREYESDYHSFDWFCADGKRREDS